MPSLGMCTDATPAASFAQLAAHALRKRMVMDAVPIGGYVRACAAAHAEILFIAKTQYASAITQLRASWCVRVAVASVL